MSGHKHEPVHKWVEEWAGPVEGINRIQYLCLRCGLTTLNGNPIPKPFDKKCVKNLTSAV